MPIFLIPIVLLILYALERALFHKYWERGLSVSLDFAQEAVTEGDEAGLVEVITNRNFLPLHILQVNFQTDIGLDFTDSSNFSVTDRVNVLDVFSLKFYERVTRKLSLSCKKRGYYNILRTSLVASDLFSPDIHYANRDQKTSIYVYPKELPDHVVAMPFQQIMGEVMSKRFLYEDNFTFRGIRDYAPTDIMSSINWKASARTGSLKVNLHDYTSSPEIMIVLNVEEPGILFETELLENCIRLTLTIAKKLISENVPVSLLTNGKDKVTDECINLQAGASNDHIRNFCRALARIDLVAKKTADIEGLVLNELSLGRSDLITYVFISTSKRENVLRTAEALTDKAGKLLWLCPLTKSMDQGNPMDKRVEFIPVIYS
ncbi:MAG: DUF58 domain-containing protein [Butyrivibrio sp.]|nr:DUF58 domain-containing protein [Butyrivibrio sp.]